MTISNEKKIILPVWLVSTIISLLVTLVTVWGLITAKAAAIEVRVQHNETNIKEVKETKVGREEFKLLLDKLNSIEKKIDRVEERSKR